LLAKANFCHRGRCVTLGAAVPARELLADFVFETGQPANALRDYEAMLATDPNRLRSVFGVVQAAGRTFLVNCRGRADCNQGSGNA
jgi:hypothetical protein